MVASGQRGQTKEERDAATERLDKKLAELAEAIKDDETPSREKILQYLSVRDLESTWTTSEKSITTNFGRRLPDSGICIMYIFGQYLFSSPGWSVYKNCNICFSDFFSKLY